MRKSFYSVLIGALIALAACSDKGNEFRLTGKIAPLPDTTVWLYGMFSIPDSIVEIPVKEGKIDYTLPMDTTTPLYLYIASLHKEIPLFADKQLTIQVEGDTTGHRRLKATGGSLQEAYNAFTDSVANLQNDQKIREKAEEFIAAHPQSVVSIYLIDNYFVRRKQPEREEMERMVNHLSGIMHDHPFIAMLQNDLKEMKDRKRDRQPPMGTLRDTTGTFLKTADYKDKFTVFSLWASWHKESRSMQDSLKQTIKQFAKKPVKFVSLSLDTDREAWLSAIREDSLQGIHTCDFKGWEGNFIPYCETEKLPALFIMNTNGRIIAADKWGKELEDYLDKQVKAWEEQKKKSKKK